MIIVFFFGKLYMGDIFGWYTDIHIFTQLIYCTYLYSLWQIYDKCMTNLPPVCDKFMTSLWHIKWIMIIIRIPGYLIWWCLELMIFLAWPTSSISRLKNGWERCWIDSWGHMFHSFSYIFVCWILLVVDLLESSYLSLNVAGKWPVDIRRFPISYVMGGITASSAQLYLRVTTIIWLVSSPSLRLKSP